MFKKEVSETFFRCVKMGYEQDLAVIELNGLKIAEDRTFADCARHVFASILDLCLPYAATCKAEYHSLFQPDVPDIGTQVVFCVVMSPLVALEVKFEQHCMCWSGTTVAAMYAWQLDVYILLQCLLHNLCSYF